MKKEMILEKWKTKTISLLMAGIMVFAMAPLGTAVAFADEENAEPAEEPVVEAVEEPAVEAVEEPAVEDAIEAAATEEISAAAINKGYITIDLSTGTKVYKVTQEDLDAYANGTGKMPEGLVAVQYLISFAEMGVIGGVDSEQDHCMLFDLDNNGSYDIQISQSVDATQTNGFYTLTRLGTCSITKEKTLTIPDQYLQMIEEQMEPNAEYYMGLKVVFAASPVAKKANTLTLKAKKMTKIKAKKMKKKAKSFNLSKFVTISGAQGPVTYAKASGNKKITVAPNGTVTLKKKIKKGTYKVKVNVTAAGNANFNAVTKAVTFKVKVK